MKRLQNLLAAVLLLAAALHSQAALVTSLDDILLWTGTGTNRSALLVDFHDGETRQSFVWGFRWSGSATGLDMLTALDNAWTELTLDNPAFVNTVTYVEGPITHSQSSNWVTTSWGYFVAGGTATQFSNSPPYGPIGTLNVPNGGLSLPVAWTVSPSGSADRFLADGSWDALSYGVYNQTTFEPEAPPTSSAYAAIPEPSAIALLVVAGTLVAYVQRKRLHTA